MVVSVIIVSMALQGQVLAAGVQNGEVAGCIDQMRGEVYFKKTRSDAPSRLTKRNAPKWLHVGDRLPCGPGGYVKICLCKRQSTCREIKGPSGWYPIPRSPLSKDDPRWVALQHFGGGGRPRASGVVIFSPADDSVKAPGRFTIRWVASDQDKNITLAIFDDTNKVIWREQVADGTAGHLASDSAREALLKYSREGGKGTLKLTLTRPDEQTEQVRFSLLSSESEQDLQTELIKWDREEASLLRHAYRAYSFSSRGMLTEAVEEYEAALAETPDSRDLLMATIMANRNIGNSPRANEFVKRLPPGTKLP